MIGSGLKKFAAENGLKVSNGVAYGKLRNFAATMFEGSGFKAIIITTRFFDVEKKQQLMNVVNEHNLMKEFRVQKLEFTFDAVLITFHDNPGTMKKISAFVDFFMPLLSEYEASPANVCTQCGMEISADNWMLINGIAYNLHPACAEKISVEAENEAAAAKVENKGSYVAGLIGAIIGGLIGAVVWAIVLYMGYMASIVGIVIGWLAERFYRLLGGKNGKGKVVILAFAAIVGVVIGTFASDYFTVAQMINAGELPGFEMRDIFYIISVLLAEDAEYLRITLSNIGLGLLFAFLGEWIFLKRAYKDSKSFNMKKLQ